MMYGQKNETGCIIINLKFWAGKLAKSANYPGSYFQKLEWKLCSYILRIMPRNFSHRLFPFFSSVFRFCFTCLFVFKFIFANTFLGRHTRSHSQSYRGSDRPATHTHQKLTEVFPPPPHPGERPLLAANQVFNAWTNLVPWVPEPFHALFF